MSAVEDLAKLEQEEAEELEASGRAAAEAAAVAELANRATIKDLKAQYDCELYRVDTICGMVVIKAVSPEQYSRFHTACLSEATKPKANALLATAAVVHPASDVYEAWCKKAPALIGAIATRAIEVAGSDTTVKKV